MTFNAQPQSAASRSVSVVNEACNMILTGHFQRSEGHESLKCNKACHIGAHYRDYTISQLSILKLSLCTQPICTSGIRIFHLGVSDDTQIKDLTTWRSTKICHGNGCRATFPYGIALKTFWIICVTVPAGDIANSMHKYVCVSLFF